MWSKCVLARQTWSERIGEDKRQMLNVKHNHYAPNFKLSQSSVCISVDAKCTIATLQLRCASQDISFTQMCCSFIQWHIPQVCQTSGAGLLVYLHVANMIHLHLTFGMSMLQLHPKTFP